MLRKRAQNMIQELADEHDSLAVLPGFKKFFDRLAAKLRLQNIMKVLFTEQIEPVAADAAQQRRGQRPIDRVIDRPGNRQPGHSCTARPALGKTLRVPREKPDRPQRAQLEQRAFDAPVSYGARLRFAANAIRIGSWVSHCLRTLPANANESYRPASGRSCKVKPICSERLNNDLHPKSFHSGSSVQPPPASTPR